MTDRLPGAALRRRAVDDSMQTQHAVDDACESGRGALRAERLPRLLHEAPAACLLVDVGTGCVVQANAAGRALAPEPQLPVIAGLDTAAAYLPGSAAAQVGGDWYDLFRLPDGAVSLAIGDVMGHDLTAAAAMGQLRSVLQSYAWQGSPPAVVLDRLDQLVQGLDMAQLATCLYGRLELPAESNGPGRLLLANAGHLPPVLRSPDGSVRLLDGPESLLVGAALGTERAEQEQLIEPGCVLVLYTDGLVEHRDRDLTDGLAALQQSLASAPAGSAQQVLDSLLADLTQGELDDDVAMLVVRVIT